jgi:hypothetical protein
MADEAPLPWRPEFLAALRLLARVSEGLAARGLPRPVLVGGGAVEFYSGSALMTGDIDLTSPVQPELEAEMQRHGFVRPSGPGKLTRGWIHPDLGLGFEIVGRAPMDGNVDVAHILLVDAVAADGSIAILAVEDMIADRMGQYGSHSGGSAEMREQARELFRLHPDVDLPYLERRIRYETAGDYGVDDIEG